MSLHLIGPWLRCPDCDKIHTRVFIGPNTVCSCGKNLYRLAWEWESK